MAKVFVFCVGGTGIRVMKSVIMLAASGMKTNGYDIVPMCAHNGCMLNISLARD